MSEPATGGRCTNSLTGRCTAAGKGALRCAAICCPGHKEENDHDPCRTEKTRPIR
jgi:hypothetical protein